MNKDIIRSFIREHGVKQFAMTFGGLLKGEGTLPNGVQIRQKIDPFSISLKELWEGCVGPVSDTIDNAFWHSEDGGGALNPTGFPQATEQLLSTITIDAYNSFPGIADSIVPMSLNPRTLTERIPGFTHAEGPKPIMPGEVYPRTGFADKWVEFEEATHNKKEGVEIAVLEETIRFDQTNQILQRAQEIGEALRTERERRTVRAVLGIGADSGTTLSGVYYPSGVDTALYSSGQSNLRTNTSPIYNHPGKAANSTLEDYTDFQEVMAMHAANIRDDRAVTTARPIVWTPNTLLIPIALRTTAINILYAQGITWIANTGAATPTATTGPEIRAAASNPIPSIFQGGGVPMPFSSPFVDEVSTTAWVMYDNRKSFVRINIFPFQTFRAPVGYGWNSDVIFAMRVREWSRVVSKDFRNSVYNTGAA